MSKYPPHRSTLVILIISMLMVLGGGLRSVVAATITVVTPSSSMQPERSLSSTLPTIRFFGPIVEGDSERLREVLANLRGARSPGVPFAVIEFNSNGGDVYEGLNIGYLLREYDVASLVRKGDICLSSCALAFLGGTAGHLPPGLLPDRGIEIGGEVGFHNFFINPDSPSLAAVADPRTGMIVGFDLGRSGSSLLVRYAAMMSLDPTFIARLLGRPSEIWEFIDRSGRFVDLASCPISVERPAQSDAELAANICNNATGGVTLIDSSRAHLLPSAEARRLLLGLVQKNVASPALKGPLMSELGRALAGKDDRLVGALYDDLRQAGIHLPNLIGKTFEVTGFKFGAYELQCHVSLSPTDPDRYEVAISSPAGLSGPLKSAPEKCRRLFLFDRSDMLNPPRL